MPMKGNGATLSATSPAEESVGAQNTTSGKRRPSIESSQDESFQAGMS